MANLMASKNLILSVLNDVAENFTDDTSQNVLDLLKVNEVGVALEVLCSQLYEYEIDITSDNRNKLIEAANLTGISLSNLEGLI